MLSSSIYLDANGKIPFLMSSIVFLCVNVQACVYYIFIHSSANEHFGYFHILAIVIMLQWVWI